MAKIISTGSQIFLQIYHFFYLLGMYLTPEKYFNQKLKHLEEAESVLCGSSNLLEHILNVLALVLCLKVEQVFL